METLRVLVTDDEIGMRYSIERALRKFAVGIPDLADEVRFEIDQAATGEEALEKIAQSPPDLLLLDHRMPGISGMDVLDAVAERVPEVLTIMITAYASIATVVGATKRGAFDFLPKPFTPEELRSVVRKSAARVLLARRNRQLEKERRRVRFELIRLLGHELKAPLAAVEGYLHLIRDTDGGLDPEKARTYLDRGLFRIEGMKKLIDDLLDMTRIESGRKKRDLKRIDLGEVAAQLAETWMPKAREHQVRLECRVEGPAAMLADRGELEMLLNNLVSNAVKYNRPGGKVTVELERRPGAIRLRVADTGIGIATADRRRLFDDFVRVRSPQTKNIPGSGLGLSIVKRLVDLYGGCIDLESTPGEGTTFTVDLPEGRRLERDDGEGFDPGRGEPEGLAEPSVTAPLPSAGP